MKKEEAMFSHLSDDEFELTVKNLLASCKKMPLYNENPGFRDLVSKLDTGLDNFSDAVAAEISAKLIAQIKLEEAFKQQGTTYVAARISVIAHILQNPCNEQAKKLARDFIQIEKDNDMHQPAIWKDIFQYL